MTQDELKLTEACQDIRFTLTPEIAVWTNHSWEEVWKAQRDQLLQDAAIPDRLQQAQQRLQQKLEHTLQHRILPQIVQQSLHILHKSQLFSQEERLNVQSQVEACLARWQPSIPVVMPTPQHLLHPTKTAWFMVALGGLGWSVGWSLGWVLNRLTSATIESIWLLPLLLTLGFVGSGTIWLTRKQREIHTPSTQTRSTESFPWIFQAHLPQGFAQEPAKRLVQSVITEALHDVAMLIEHIGLIELLRREHQQEASDQWTHFFQRCQDGLAEVYYSETKRDPERALDACIKLIADLNIMGVETEMIEKGRPFGSDMETMFQVSGRIQEEDPVMTILPAWKQHGQLLHKGTIKRYGR